MTKYEPIKNTLPTPGKTGEKRLGLNFRIWLWFHVIVCRFWNWRLPSDLNEKVYEWSKIDHRKDKSLSGRDFRLWLYIRMIDKHQFKLKKIKT